VPTLGGSDFLCQPSVLLGGQASACNSKIMSPLKKGLFIDTQIEALGVSFRSFKLWNQPQASRTIGPQSLLPCEPLIDYQGVTKFYLCALLNMKKQYMISSK